MPGIPLLNLGTALGGFTQGYQNAENNRIQNALRQIALSQALSQQRAQALAGRGLAAGLLDQLQTNTPQMLPTGAPPMPTGGATPPMPGAPSVPAAPPVQTATTSPALPPVPDATAALGSSEDRPDAVPPYDTGAYAPGGTTIGRKFMANPQPWSLVSGGLSADTESLRAPLDPAPPAAPSDASTQTASAGGSDVLSEPAITHVDATLPNGRSIGIPDLFRSVDPSKIAQGLARLAPPGTDPADIYAATTDLLKLANGNKTEQWQAALLGKELGFQFHAADAAANRESRERVAAAGREAAGERQDKTLAGQAERQQVAIGARTQAAAQAQADRKELLGIREGAIDARSKARLEAMAAAAAQRAGRVGNTNAKTRIDAIKAQISAIKAEGKTGGGMFSSPTISPENQKKLADLAGQLAVINGELATPTQPAGP